jgi:2-dehydropantoate 2-reductase
MRVLVFGAGVIGRIYAGRLLAAGHEVAMVCRGATVDELAQTGIVLRRDGVLADAAHPAVFTDVQAAGCFDIALIAIRRDQVREALPQLLEIRAVTVVSLIDLPTGIEELAAALGVERFVPAFPGAAGALRQDGVVDYLEVAQQPTTIGSARENSVATELFNSAGFRTATTVNMAAWLQTHAVFIAAFESAIASSTDGVAGLARDRTAMRSLVLAVREGLRALEANRVVVLPPSIRVIFLLCPVWFAARYWSRQLAGPLGMLGMAPHSLASAHTELPALQDDVRSMLIGQPMSRLESLFAVQRLGLGTLPAKIWIA